MDMARQHQSLDAVQKRGTWSQAESMQERPQQSNRSRLKGNWLGRSEILARNAKHFLAKSRWDSHSSRVVHVARSVLRAGFRGCRQRGKTRSKLVVTVRTSSLVEGRFLGPPKLRGSMPKLETSLLSKATELESQCSPTPFETGCQIQQSCGCLSHTAKWSDFDASQACCTVFVCGPKGADSSCANSS